MSVPNYIPSKPFSPRLAIVGEAPAGDEVRNGRPFVGASGQLLGGLLARVGIPIDRVMLGNICQERAPGDNLNRFKWDGPEITEGIEELTNDLCIYKPDLVLLMGANPLRAALGARLPIGNFHSTLVTPSAPGFSKYKAMACYHPAAALRDYSLRYEIHAALKRASWVLSGKPHSPPAEHYEILPTPAEVVSTLKKLRKAKAPVALDIEGRPAALRCVGIAWSPEDGLIIDMENLKQPQVERAFREFLADPAVGKVFHNGPYDQFVLMDEPYRYVIAGIEWDTMFAEWEIACELPKSLMDCAARHTWRGYWKGDWKTEDKEVLHRYCLRDSTATLEIYHSQRRAIKETCVLRHLRTNLEMLPAFLYMELRGIRFDLAKAEQRRVEIQKTFHVEQHALDLKTGMGCLYPDKMAKALASISMKRAKVSSWQELTEAKCKKDYRARLSRVRELMRMPPSPERNGELSCLLDIERSVFSTAFGAYLYDECGFPEQTKKDPKTGEWKRTTDEVALLRLRKKVQSEIPAIALRIRYASTRIKALSHPIDPDGRVRATLNIVGQETGRVSVSESPRQTGFNLTTVSSDDRDLFLADEDHWMGQADLEGADSWTVAAVLASKGAPRMLEDLRAGVRPAKVAVLLRSKPDLWDLSSGTMLKATKAVDKKDPRYLMAKKVVHGSCYRMGPRTVSTSVYLESGGEIELDEGEAREWQDLVNRRYRFRLYHDAIERQLQEERVIRTPSGQIRRFMGWPEKTVGEALAHAPQNNTTWANNLALLKSWKDPENWKDGKVGAGRPRCEVLLVIHDALLFQFHKRDLPFVKKKLPIWYDNPLVIAGTPIVIPYEAKYGESWGNLKEGSL